MDLLASSSVLTANYGKLVPVVVSYDDFWMRYLFREQRVRDREKERQELILKASEVVLTPQVDMSWDDAEWKDQVGEEINFSQGTVNTANGLNYSSNTVLNMIEGAVGSPSVNDSLLLDGWDDGKTEKQADVSSVASPIPAKANSSGALQMTPQSTNKIALEIIEDYAGWE